MTQPNQPNQEIKIQDALAGAEYANAMQISHNKEEFYLNFFNIAPPTGRVCAKIITNPGHLKRMIAALQDNLKKYEAQFGVVTEAESSLDKEIGFKTS
ncbi:MAG: DUF3467 domain-containing protein [Candidatus Buchananbacteria bacterium]